MTRRFRLLKLWLFTFFHKFRLDLYLHKRTEVETLFQRRVSLVTDLILLLKYLLLLFCFLFEEERRRKEKEFFTAELQRLKKSLKEESKKIKKPKE